MKQRSKTKSASLKLVNNMVELKFHLTLGETLSLKNALANYDTAPCAQDVLAYLRNAEYESKINI